jgi:eIF4-gamma/eIF5/eIF2-epsilon/Domain found in IF2B/IF5
MQDLQRLMNFFIDKFVLCPRCSLPETALAVSLKKGAIFHKCSACGAKDPLDMSHKLCAYIIKQAELAHATAAAAEGKSGDKKAKKEKKVSSHPTSIRRLTPILFPPHPRTTPGSQEKKEKKEKKEKTEKKEKSEEVAEEDAEASSEEEARPAAAPAAPAAALQAPPPSFLSAVSALLAQPKDVAEAKRLGKGLAASAVLLAFQDAVNAASAAAAKNAPLALEALYDADVITEEAILQWYDGVEGNAGVKAKAKVFCEWLKNADEDEEEDE